MLATVWMVLASVCWGATNPFLKHGAQGFDRVQGSLWRRVKFLSQRWRFAVPFCINQCGSVFFALSVTAGSLGTVATVVNALTFLFTAVVDALCGQGMLLSWRMMVGIALILLGAHLSLTAQTGHQDFDGYNMHDVG